MSLTAGLVELAVRAIDLLGLWGVFLLMALESMIAPVPSEGVMPFAGFLVATGRFPSFWVVVAVSTAGSIAGSWISYELGKHWGRPAVVRWGRWVLLSERDLDRTDRFFRRFGTWAVFLARLVPVVRHLISIPAGVARMSLLPFLVATLLGAAIWNAFLAYVGLQLGENWDEVKDAMEPFDYALASLLVLGFVVFVWTHIRRIHADRRSAPTPPEEGRQ